jgi:hypothetical protein
LTAGWLGDEPAPLENLGDALLHGRGDVAVDAAHAGQAVAEPFGLGDLGDVVLVNPLVAWRTPLCGLGASRLGHEVFVVDG